jgi:hypothetical protein
VCFVVPVNILLFALAVSVDCPTAPPTECFTWLKVTTLPSVTPLRHMRAVPSAELLSNWYCACTCDGNKFRVLALLPLMLLLEDPLPPIGVLCLGLCVKHAVFIRES